MVISYHDIIWWYHIMTWNDNIIKWNDMIISYHDDMWYDKVIKLQKLCTQ